MNVIINFQNYILANIVQIMGSSSPPGSDACDMVYILISSIILCIVYVNKNILQRNVSYGVKVEYIYIYWLSPVP